MLGAVLLTALAAANPPGYQWHTFYNNPNSNGYIDAPATAVDAAGNVYVAGTCGYHNQFECWPNPVRRGGWHTQPSIHALFFSR